MGVREGRRGGRRVGRGRMESEREMPWEGGG